jgi:DNA-binding transcriptional ArsR family regulator
MMNADRADDAVAKIAAAIAEPARARMLYCLMDDRARTATELAVIAGVSPSTASVHLGRLQTQRLVKVQVQGKHRYYMLEGADVARALESLSVLAGDTRRKFKPAAPHHLRLARTCYDHIAGALGVALHDRFKAMGWLSAQGESAYDLSPSGLGALEKLGVDIAGVRAMRRRFAFPCLDWSERRCHLGGSLGAAVLDLTLRKKWIVQHLDSRAVDVTKAGRRELLAHFGLHL